MIFNSEIESEFLELTKNQDAWKFVKVFGERSHILDDLMDDPEKVTDETLIEKEVEWMITLSTNPFYLANAQSLMPAIVSGANAWLDSNKWSQSNSKVKRCHSDVVKSIYHEVVFLSVYLCGGWEALREFSLKHREYQVDNYGPLQ